MSVLQQTQLFKSHLHVQLKTHWQLIQTAAHSPTTVFYLYSLCGEYLQMENCRKLFSCTVELFGKDTLVFYTLTQ